MQDHFLAVEVGRSAGRFMFWKNINETRGGAERPPLSTSRPERVGARVWARVEVRLGLGTRARHLVEMKVLREGICKVVLQLEAATRAGNGSPSQAH